MPEKNLIKMKVLICLFLFLPCLTFSQTETERIVDSLKYVKATRFGSSYNSNINSKDSCGDQIFWKLVKQRQKIIPSLIDKLSDTTITEVQNRQFGMNYRIGDIAFEVLQEIIKYLPRYNDANERKRQYGCGYDPYWYELYFNFNNRQKYQTEIREWYKVNKDNLVWVTNENCLTCRCNGVNPNKGHFEIQK
jgi:hypothetical protein